MLLKKDALPRLRRERGLTQEDLARRLFITRQADKVAGSAERPSPAST